MMDASFWAMGGYAAYVWPAYAIGVGLILALAVASWSGYRAARAEVARLEAEGAHRRKAPAGS